MKKNIKKIRVNITVDKALLSKAKKKLNLFGGKLSTLFNAYLSEFNKSISQTPTKTQEELIRKIKELEARIKKLEQKN